MRTQEEIVARIKDPASQDFLMTQRGDLLAQLEYEHAKQFMKEDTTAEGWKGWPVSDEAIRAAAVEYLEFAWGKANTSRGLSSQRSIDHYRAWFWLLGDEEMVRALSERHTMYGKPQLVKISEKLGVDWRKLDNDRWHNFEGDDGVTADDALKFLAEREEAFRDAPRGEEPEDVPWPAQDGEPVIDDAGQPK